MLIYEFKIEANPSQYSAIDEAIRAAQFIRNKCLRCGVHRNFRPRVEQRFWRDDRYWGWIRPAAASRLVERRIPSSLGVGVSSRIVPSYEPIAV